MAATRRVIYRLRGDLLPATVALPNVGLEMTSPDGDPIPRDEVTVMLIEDAGEGGNGDTYAFVLTPSLVEAFGAAFDKLRGPKIEVASAAALRGLNGGI